MGDTSLVLTCHLSSPTVADTAFSLPQHKPAVLQGELRSRPWRCGGQSGELSHGTANGFQTRRPELALRAENRVGWRRSVES